MGLPPLSGYRSGSSHERSWHWLGLTVRARARSSTRSVVSSARQPGRCGFQGRDILAERRSQLAGTLSGGEQQMLAIGRALMSGPALLLLDEPSLGIAPQLVQRIFASLTDINRREIAIVLVEQRVQQALHLASRGYVLQTGRLTLAGPSAALLNSEDVRRSYLGL